MQNTAPNMNDCPEIVVVPISELAHADEGPERGYAHVGFDDYPAHAPGRLDFEPLMLFGFGDMKPGQGFPLHRHEGIENGLLILEGQIRHEDHRGEGGVAGPGDFSMLSAGSGAEHSEFVEGDVAVKALVFWLRSDAPEAPCQFYRRRATREGCRDQWVELASGRRTRSYEALPLRNDSSVLMTVLRPGGSVDHRLEPGRNAYLIAVDGGLEVNGRGVGPGDRVMARGPGLLEVFARGAGDAQVLLIDMPAPGPGA